MKAVTLVRLAPYSVVLFLGSGALGFISSWLRDPLSGWAWLLCLVGFFFYGFCRIGASVLRSREFARGYTTIKSYSKEYRYVHDKSELNSSSPAVRQINRSSAESHVRAHETEVSNSIRTNPFPLKTQRNSRRIAIAGVFTLILAWVVLSAVRFWSLAEGGQDAVALDFVLFLGAGFVILYAGLTIGQISIASRGYRQARKYDRGRLFASLRSSGMIRAAAMSSSDAMIRTYIVVGFDKAGLRVWNIAGRTSARPAYEVNWSEVVTLMAGDAMSRPLRSSAIISVLVGDARVEVPVRICNPYLPILPGSRAYCAQIYSELAEARASSSS